MELRLECLRIAAGLGAGLQEPADIVRAAAELEAYVTRSPGTPSPQAGTPHKCPEIAAD